MKMAALWTTLLTLVVLGLISVWFGGRESSTAAVAPARSSHGPVIPDLQETITEQLSTSTVSPGTSFSPAAARPPPSAPQPLTATQPGSYIKIPSIELRTYYVLLGIGGAGDVSIEAVRQRFDLTEEELAALAAHARTAVQADARFQSAMQEEICAARNTYQSVEEFGRALNVFKSRADSHQEHLGREAASGLDPVLFAKIDSAVRGAPTREQMSMDAAVAFAHQKRDLETVVGHFCSYRY